MILPSPAGNCDAMHLYFGAPRASVCRVKQITATIPREAAG
jgi:hypothetical protein